MDNKNRNRNDDFFRFMGSWMAGAAVGKIMANIVIRIASIYILYWVVKQMFMK
jgi:hypothetical protein